MVASFADPPTGDRVTRIREQIDTLRAERELRALSAENARLQREEAFDRRLTESAYYGYSSNQWGELVDPADAYRDSDLRITPLGTASRHNRRDGFNRPFVWTEIDLDFSREYALWVVTRNLLATGAVESLCDYTVRQGYEYEPRPGKAFAGDMVAKQLARQVQAVIDEFRSFNRIESLGEQYTWADREWDAAWRGVVHGEVFLRLFDQHEDGLCLARFVEPEQVRQPAGTGPSWSLGIEHAPGDVERVLNYAVAYDHPDDWEAVRADEVAYLGWNKPSCVKRGLSDLYPCAETFDSTAKMIRNMLVTGGVQAAIAWIEQFEQAGVEALQAHVNAQRDQNRPQYPRPVTGRDVNYQRLEPGSIPKVGGGRTYVPQPTAVNSGSHTTTVQAGMRALGARWRMPEYMISGDASNANYSSTLVAGAPFVVRIECRQQRYGQFFTSALWKGPIAAAARAGRFEAGGRRYTYDEVSRLVDVIATPPKVAISDLARETQQDRDDVAAGALSMQTYRARRGFDDETEEHNLKQRPLTRVQGKATDLDAQGDPVAKGQGDGEGKPGEGKPGEGPASNDLRATVGGLQAVLALQQSVYKGEVPRAAAIANAEVMFGFSQAEAAKLFPDVPPEKTADDGQGGQQQAGGDQGGGLPDAGGADLWADDGAAADASPEVMAEALREAAWLDEHVTSLRESHREGETWQGPSGRWFTISGGRAVPAAAPGGKEPGGADHPGSPAAAPASRPGVVSAISAASSAAKTKMTAAGKAAYARLPKPAQRAVDAGLWVEHQLEGLYAGGQEMAKAVAKERGLSEEHVERVGRVLGWADGFSRWTGNIPLAHHLLEAVAHVGGPAGFALAKAGYYLPVASLAYMGYHVARATAAGHDPVKLLGRARTRAREALAAKHAAAHPATPGGGHP